MGYWSWLRKSVVEITKDKDFHVLTLTLLSLVLLFVTVVSGLILLLSLPKGTPYILANSIAIIFLVIIFLCLTYVLYITSEDYYPKKEAF